MPVLPKPKLIVSLTRPDFSCLVMIVNPAFSLLRYIILYMGD